MPSSAQRHAYDAPPLELLRSKRAAASKRGTRIRDLPDSGAIADADWLEEIQVLDVTRRHGGVRKGKGMFLVLRYP